MTSASPELFRLTEETFINDADWDPAVRSRQDPAPDTNARGRSIYQTLIWTFYGVSTRMCCRLQFQKRFD